MTVEIVTVAKLIEFLKTQPQDLPVGYRRCSEQALLEVKDIEVMQLCEPRPDGWIQNNRPDMLTRSYLIFPGN